MSNHSCAKRMEPRDAASRVDTSTVLAAIRALDEVADSRAHAHDRMTDGRQLLRSTATVPVPDICRGNSLSASQISSTFDTEDDEGVDVPSTKQRMMNKIKSFGEIRYDRPPFPWLHYAEIPDEEHQESQLGELNMVEKVPSANEDDSMNSPLIRISRPINSHEVDASHVYRSNDYGQEATPKTRQTPNSRGSRQDIDSGDQDLHREHHESMEIRDALDRSQTEPEQENANVVQRIREQCEQARILAVQNALKAQEAAAVEKKVKIELGMKLLQLYSKDGWVTDLPFYLLSPIDKDAVLHALAHDFETTPLVQRSAIKIAGSKHSQARLMTRENAKFELARLAQIPQQAHAPIITGIVSPNSLGGTYHDLVGAYGQHHEKVLEWVEDSATKGEDNASGTITAPTQRQYMRPDNQNRSTSRGVLAQREACDGLGISNLTVDIVTSSAKVGRVTGESSTEHSGGGNHEVDVDYLSVYSQNIDSSPTPSRTFYNSPDPTLTSHAPIRVSYASPSLLRHASGKRTPIRDAGFFNQLDFESRRRSNQLDQRGLEHPTIRTPRNRSERALHVSENSLVAQRASIPRFRTLFSRSRSLTSDSAPPVPKIPERFCSDPGDYFRSSASPHDRRIHGSYTASLVQASHFEQNKPIMTPTNSRASSIRAVFSPLLFRRCAQEPVTQYNREEASASVHGAVKGSPRRRYSVIAEANRVAPGPGTPTVEEEETIVLAHEMDSPTIPALFYMNEAAEEITNESAVDEDVAYDITNTLDRAMSGKRKGKQPIRRVVSGGQVEGEKFESPSTLCRAKERQQSPRLVDAADADRVPSAGLAKTIGRVAKQDEKRLSENSTMMDSHYNHSPTRSLLQKVDEAVQDWRSRTDENGVARR